LASAIKQLAEAIAGHPLPPLEKPVESTPSVEQAAPSPDAPTTDQAEITFDQVHKALLEIKTKKGAAVVREVLQAFDCKTVQDIPKEKFAEVLQIAAGKLEG